MSAGKPETRIQRLTAPRPLAFVFVVGLVVLLIDNAYWLVRNQRELSCKESLCVFPRSLEKAAHLSPNPKIRALAFYYFLNEQIPHARLTVPPWMALHKWSLEHLSRLRVDVANERLIIQPQHVGRLREMSTERRKWRSRGQRRWLYLLLDATTTDYVLAETEAATGPLFVMPRSTYAAAPARVDAP